MKNKLPLLMNNMNKKLSTQMEDRHHMNANIIQTKHKSKANTFIMNAVVSNITL